jgi:Zn-dependent M16 (insulinase) family peptidase
VVHQLDTQTVEYDINLGCPITQTLEIYMKVEKSKYSTAVSWLGDLLWRSEFDADRLRINATKILQTIPSRKREGSDVSAALYDEMTFSADLAPLTSNNLFKQESSLPLVLEKLKSEPDSLIKQMEQLRSHRQFLCFFALASPVFVLTSYFSYYDLISAQAIIPANQRLR